jgi:hypothetical protein
MESVVAKKRRHGQIRIAASDPSEKRRLRRRKSADVKRIRRKPSTMKENGISKL